ncbi:MAG: class I SAM-dependent methyltransferase [Acidobacteriota bacterium]
MNALKRFAKRRLPPTWIATLRRLRRRERPRDGHYSVALKREDIENEGYKAFFGGGAASWEQRGRFQLDFLTAMGMGVDARLLDVGCGPGRASKHLVAYLDRDGYVGVDYNADFISIATQVTDEEGLTDKRPRFAVVQNFDFALDPTSIDYALAFSVLNHCDVEQKANFFRHIDPAMKPGGRIYISHAGWFEESYVRQSGLSCTRRIGADAFDILRYGWRKADSIFPIVELTRS